MLLLVRPGRDPLIRAYCLLATESYYELSAFLDTLEKHYDSRRLLIAQIEIRVFKAIAVHKTGDIPASMASRKYTYKLSNGNELFMPFIEMGKYTRAVIYTAKREKKHLRSVIMLYKSLTNAPIIQSEKNSTLAFPIELRKKSWPPP